jgi:hypothetical protein
MKLTIVGIIGGTKLFLCKFIFHFVSVMHSTLQSWKGGKTAIFVNFYYLDTFLEENGLFMAICFYQQFIVYNTESFAKVENLSKLTFTLFKFIVVI